MKYVAERKIAESWTDLGYMTCLERGLKTWVPLVYTLLFIIAFFAGFLQTLLGQKLLARSSDTWLKFETHRDMHVEGHECVCVDVVLCGMCVLEKLFA